MNNFYKKGITTVELLIIAATLGIIFSIILPQFSKIRENQVLKNTTIEVVSGLNKARAQTLASLNSSSYGVHFQSDKVIIFKGVVFSAGDANNEVIDFTVPANISNISLGAGVSDIFFARLSGIPNKTGTVTVSTPSYSKIITISATGAINVN